MKPKPRRAKRVPDQADVPNQPREIPTFCPLFPTVRCASVGKIVLQAIEYDDTGEEHRQHIVHPRVTPEMDEADIAAIAGGGDYYVAVHKNDGTGQMISHRKLEIFGPPKEFDYDDEDSERDGKGRPTVIPVPGGEPIIIPSGIKGSDQAAYIAQQQQIRGLQKQSEGGGAVGQMMTGMFGMVTAMMTGGGQNNAALMALQGQLNAANTEKATLIAQHGGALNALREEHAATMAMLRGELSKAMDECRRLTTLMESRVAEALFDERRKSTEDQTKLRADIHRLEQSLLGRDREIVRMAGDARAGSETVELARLFAPRLDAALGKLGGSSLPPELKSTIDSINHEVVPAVRKLMALSAMADTPSPEPAPQAAPQPVAESAPSSPDETPANGNGNGNGAPLVPKPRMPG